ncbi:hypothetical protein AVEN_189227-1, partial [Araneus ventricosus]
IFEEISRLEKTWERSSGSKWIITNIVAKGLSVVYGVNSPTRRIMENEGLFTNMQENTQHRYRKQ